MNAPRAALLVLVGSGVLGCTAETSRVLPDIVRTSGVEVATLEKLPATLDPAFRWSLQVIREIPTVGDLGAAPLVFDPHGVLPISGNRLLIYDPSADDPLVLLDLATDSVVSRFGREGEGPGELGGWLSFGEVGGDILVFDSGNRHVHRFQTTGTLVSSTPFDTDVIARKPLLLPDRPSFLVEGFHSDEGGWHNVLDRVELSGEASRLLRLPTPPEGAQPGDLQVGRAIWTVLDESVVTMWSATPVLTVHSQTGDKVREIRLPLTSRRVTERDIAKEVQRVGVMASSMRPGPTAMTNDLFAFSDSVFGMLLTDIRRAAEDPPLPPGEIWWRLFSVRGEYLGVLEPMGDYESFQLVGRGSGTVWVKSLDEHGFPIIREVRLRPPLGDAGPAS